mgnify:CR=1 FL=1
MQNIRFTEVSDMYKAKKVQSLKKNVLITLTMPSAGPLFEYAEDFQESFFAA